MGLSPCPMRVSVFVKKYGPCSLDLEIFEGGHHLAADPFAALVLQSSKLLQAETKRKDILTPLLLHIFSAPSRNRSWRPCHFQNRSQPRNRQMGLRACNRSRGSGEPWLRQLVRKNPPTMLLQGTWQHLGCPLQLPVQAKLLLLRCNRHALSL